MGPYKMKAEDLNPLIKHQMYVCALCALLIFIALNLLNFIKPQHVPTLAALCLALFSFVFGMWAGFMEIKQRIEKGEFQNQKGAP